MADEIKEEKLDSPLVVHKKGDASYQEEGNEVSMQNTHVDEDSDAPTLERHRFKKEKKKWPYMLAVIVVVAVVVIALLVNNGTINLSKKETTSASTKSYTTDVVNPFKDTITVKGTYIFYEGTELDDIGSLEREIKYQDADKTFTVQDEHADSNFLNKEVLPLLTKYKMKYNVTHIQSSGLISKYEATTQAVSDTAPSSDAQVSDAQPPQQ